MPKKFKKRKVRESFRKKKKKKKKKRGEVCVCSQVGGRTSTSAPVKVERAHNSLFLQRFCRIRAGGWNLGLHTAHMPSSYNLLGFCKLSTRFCHAHVPSSSIGLKCTTPTIPNLNPPSRCPYMGCHKLNQLSTQPWKNKLQQNVVLLPPVPLYYPWFSGLNYLRELFQHFPSISRWR